MKGATLAEPYALDLDSERFHDQLLGCWMGKNCGGTLGAPTEQAWGEAEPLDIWWYPELRAGGIPNDDLELQLIWLVALEDVGPGLTARDLAQRWLDHIVYNPDEYAFCKTNMRLGLEPPVSGYYNNWFKDGMGSPIRSELWACVAPGHPRVAVRYAFEDAICDHAGGEGVYGELFNAAVEAAAFVVSDRSKLIEIGLSFIPDDCLTAQAIRAAMGAHADGRTWQEARARVLEATPHHNSQYAPVNLGFEIVGWLYGTDFGDALCKAVNCGYDTDCTGATLGSILGIVAGISGLPARWIEPLGDGIATNEANGGLRHLSDGPNPIPTTISELAARIEALAKRVLSAHTKLDGMVTRIEEEHLYADDAARELWRRSPLRVPFPGLPFCVEVDYMDTVAVVPHSHKAIAATIGNPHPIDITVNGRLIVPPGWHEPPTQSVTVPANGDSVIRWLVETPGRESIENSNRLFIALEVEDYPQMPALPVVLIGASATRVSTSYTIDGGDPLGEAHPPESRTGETLEARGRPGEWRELRVLDNSLPLDEAVPEGSVAYVQTFFEAPTGKEVVLGVDCSHPTRAWLNGEELFRKDTFRPIRPSYYGQGPGDYRIRLDGYQTVRLREGWNELLVKVARPLSSPRPECHIVLSQAEEPGAGLTEIGRTRYPWDRR